MDPLEQEARDALNGKTIDVVINVWERINSSHFEMSEAVRQYETENVLNPSAENQDKVDKAKADLRRSEAYHKVAGEIIQEHAPEYFARYNQQDQSHSDPGQSRRFFKMPSKGKLVALGVLGAAVLWLGGQGRDQRQDAPGFDPTDVGVDSPTRRPSGPPQPLTPEQLETEFCDVDYGMGATLANSSLWEAEGNRERAREILREKLEVFDGERGCGPENIDAAVEEGRQEIDKTAAKYGISDIPGSRTLIQCKDGTIETAQDFGKNTGIARGQNCPVEGLSHNQIAQTPDGKGIVLERGGL